VQLQEAGALGLRHSTCGAGPRGGAAR
jgi:hypothetical protein